MSALADRFFRVIPCGANLTNVKTKKLACYIIFALYPHTLSPSLTPWLSSDCCVVDNSNDSCMCDYLCAKMIVHGWCFALTQSDAEPVCWAHLDRSSSGVRVVSNFTVTVYLNMLHGRLCRTTQYTRISMWASSEYCRSYHKDNKVALSTYGCAA